MPPSASPTHQLTHSLTHPLTNSLTHSVKPQRKCHFWNCVCCFLCHVESMGFLMLLIPLGRCHCHTVLFRPCVVCDCQMASLAFSIELIWTRANRLPRRDQLLVLRWFNAWNISVLDLKLLHLTFSTVFVSFQLKQFKWIDMKAGKSAEARVY